MTMRQGKCKRRKVDTIRNTNIRVHNVSLKPKTLRRIITHVISNNISISLLAARPSTSLSIIFIIYVVPSRQGVH